MFMRSRVTNFFTYSLKNTVQKNQCSSITYKFLYLLLNIEIEKNQLIVTQKVFYSEIFIYLVSPVTVFIERIRCQKI